MHVRISVFKQYLM